MAGPTVQVVLVGWRDNRGRFAAQSEELVKRQQKVARELLTTLSQRAAELSPRQDEEEHDQREPGKQPFAEQWDVQVSMTKDGAEGALTNKADYANLVLFPTRGHPIDKEPGTLVFEGKDGTVYTHHVEHPGTHGHPEIAQQLENESQRLAQSRLQQVAQQAAVGIEGVFSRYAGRL